MIRTILSIQPREAGGGADTKTPDQVVLELVKAI
jgi:hypothetical protein